MKEKIVLWGVSQKAETMWNYISWMIPRKNPSHQKLVSTNNPDNDDVFRHMKS